MTPRLRKRLRIAVGFAATGAFLGLFATQVDLGDAIHRFASLPWWATVAGAAMVFVNLVFMSIRWRYLLRAGGYDVALWPLVKAASVGQAGSNILPFRGGDVLRVESVRERGVSGFAVAGSLFAEKVLDGLTLSVWIVGGAALIGRFGAVFTIGAVLFGLSAFGVVVLNLMSRHRERVVRLTSRLDRRLRPEWRERAEESVAHFVDGLGAFADRRLLALATLASLGMWLADVVMYAIVGRAYDLPVGLGAYFLLEGVANLALGIPAAAAGIGTFDYLTLIAAQGIDVPTHEATAYVLTVHLLTVVPITLFGAVLLRRAFPLLRRPART